MRKSAKAPKPVLAAEVDFLFLEDEKRPFKFQLFIWRTLPELRLANKLPRNSRTLALCWQGDGKVFAAIHLARTSIQADLLAHELQHAATQLRRTFGLDDDEHDEEANAEISGLLSHLVAMELEKLQAISARKGRVE